MNFLQGGILRSDRTFLGYRQQTASICHRFDGISLTIWLGPGYYILYLTLGIAFGPGLTFALLDHPPLGALLVGGFFNIVGYVILISSLFIRRWITIDFARDEITFFTRFITRGESTITFDEISRLRTYRDLREYPRISSPPYQRLTYYLSIDAKSKQTFALVETMRRDKIERIAEILSRELHSRIPLAIEIPPASPQEIQATENSKGIARFAIPAFFLALICLGTSLITGYDVYRAYSARNWPSTNGQILVSRTFRDLTPSRHNVVRLSSRVQIRYRYIINGEIYENNQVSFDAHDRATTSIRFPDGASTNVWYNPKNPQIAVLDRNLGSWTYSLFGISVFLLIAYIVYVYNLPQHRRRRRQKDSATASV